MQETSLARFSSSRVPNPWRVFLAVLLTVFLVEAAVMYLLPVLPLGRFDERTIALLDACLLTCMTAPILWWVVIRPLRRIVVTEAAKAESIVAVALEGIVTVDQRGVVDVFNLAAEQIFGYRAEEVVGRDATLLIPAELAAQHQQALLRYRTADESNIIGRTMEVSGLRKDGSQVPISLSVSQFEVEGHSFFTGILRDLTAAKYRQRQQAAMVEFGKRALVHGQLEPLLCEAVQYIAETLRVDCSAVFQRSSSGETLLLTHGVGWAVDTVGEVVVDAKGERVPGRALDGATVLDVAIGESNGIGFDLLRDQGIRGDRGACFTLRMPLAGTATDEQE